MTPIDPKQFEGHTPGPFSVNEKQQIVKEADIGKHAYFVIAEAGGRGYTPEVEAEISANRKLLAAAPTLLRENAELREALDKIQFSASGRLSAKKDTLRMVVGEIQGICRAALSAPGKEKENDEP